MKRSEALKIIEEQYSKFVEDWLELDIEDEDAVKSFERLEERVLSALENAGVLPPPTGHVKVQTSGEDLMIPLFKWESEE